MVEAGTVDDRTVVVPTFTYVFNGLFLFIIKLTTEIYNTLPVINIDWVS